MSPYKTAGSFASAPSVMAARVRRRSTARGSTSIPGLVNAHVHLWKQSDLRVALQAGVFAVFDLHSSEGPDASFRRLRDSSSYASYYSAGYAATVPHGHPTELFPIETVNDSVTPEQFVEHRLAKGADLIKIISGNLTPGSLWATNPTLSFAQIDAITRAAKARNEKVVVHVSQIGETVRIARMGVDGFAHLWSYGESATDEQLRVLKDAGVFVIPTVLLQQRAWQTIEREPDKEHAFKGIPLADADRAARDPPSARGGDPDRRRHRRAQLWRELRRRPRRGAGDLRAGRTCRTPTCCGRRPAFRLESSSSTASAESSRDRGRT